MSVDRSWTQTYFWSFSDSIFKMILIAGEGNYFTLSSSVQQDLSEFLLSGQQDLLTVATTTAGITTGNSADNSNEIVHEVFNLPVTSSNDCVTANTHAIVDEHSDLQDLNLQNLESLDSLLVNRYVLLIFLRSGWN